MTRAMAAPAGWMGGGLVPRQMIHAPQCFAESAGRCGPAESKAEGVRVSSGWIAMSSAADAQYCLRPGPHSPENGLPAHCIRKYKGARRPAHLKGSWVGWQEDSGSQDSSEVGLNCAQKAEVY